MGLDQERHSQDKGGKTAAGKQAAGKQGKRGHRGSGLSNLRAMFF